MAQERYAIRGGQKVLTESPVLKKLIAEELQNAILVAVKKRFKTIGRDVTKQLRAILDKDKLIELIVAAGQCSDLEAFREAMAK